MYRKIRITVVSLVAVMACVFSSTGTLSYFTDSDGTINNFTVGNASTVLAIYDDVSDANNKRALDASRYTVTDNLDVPIYLQATNDGNIPVYQRFRVVIPKVLAGVVTLNLPAMTDSCVVETVAQHTCSNADYTVIYDEAVEATEYAEYYVVSNSALAVNDVTKEWPTLGIHFGELTSVDNYQSLLTCGNDNSGNNCALGIRVYSDAIQTNGFVNGAVDAFTGFAETYN